MAFAKFLNKNQRTMMIRVSLNAELVGLRVNYFLLFKFVLNENGTVKCKNIGEILLLRFLLIFFIFYLKRFILLSHFLLGKSNFSLEKSYFQKLFRCVRFQVHRLNSKTVIKRFTICVNVFKQHI